MNRNSYSRKNNIRRICAILFVLILTMAQLAACGKVSRGDGGEGSSSGISGENGTGDGVEGSAEGSGAGSDSGMNSGNGDAGTSVIRSEYDWRENVYHEYSLDFQLDKYEPYHIYDINIVDGHIKAVAKINSETIDGSDVIYELIIADNDAPEELIRLDMPAEVIKNSKAPSGDFSILDADYSGLKMYADGSIVGVFSASFGTMNDEGAPEISYARFMTCWEKNGEVAWCTDISEYLTTEYGFVKYFNRLSNGMTVVFTENNKNYGFVINKSGEIEAGRVIDEGDALFYVSDIISDKSGRPIVFYSKTYDGSAAVNNGDAQSNEENNSDNSSGNEPEAVLYEEFHVDAAYFDVSSVSIAEGAVIPYEIRKNDYFTICPGIKSDFMYSDQNGVHTFNVGDEKSVAMMNFANSDFRGYFLTDACAVSDTEFVGVYATYDEGVMIASGFEYVNPTELDKITTIELGVYGTDENIRRIVREYNNKCKDYHVIIKDYSALELKDIDLQSATMDYVTSDYFFNDADEAPILTEGDFNAYVRKLQLEALKNDVLAGKGPDLLMIDPAVFDYGELADAGLLVEFESLVGDDVEISGGDSSNLADAYLMNVMDSFAINGKHYLYYYDFMYSVYTGREASSILPSSGMGWSIIDFDLVYSDYHIGGNALKVYDLTSAPVLIAYRTRSQFIDVMLKYDGSEFVNIEEGTCDFDSEDFISLLKYAGSLDEVNDDKRPVYKDMSVSYRNDSVLLTEMTLGAGTPDGFWSDMCRNFDGEYTCIGFPSRDGYAANSGVITMAELPIAVTNIGYKDGAWDFAKQFFKDDYQKSIIERGVGIPMLLDSFEEWFEVGKSRSAGLYYTDETGNSVFSPNTYMVAGSQSAVPYMMDNDVKVVKDSISACQKSEFTNPGICRIVREEAYKYFAGNISAEETAANIQNRVKGYLENH